MIQADALPADEQRGTVAARIRSAMDELSVKERQVARTILAQYPGAGLETTAALSALANVSGPTVVRFVARLGYGSYREFQSDLRQELTAKTASPLTKAASLADRGSTAEFTTTVRDVSIEALNGTFAELPGSEFEGALALLCDPALGLHLLGGRFTRILADYLALHLQPMRAGVRFYRDARDLSVVLPELRRKDCLVIFDFRRYQADTIALARLARVHRCKILLVTDRWMSPVAEFADVVLTARVDAASPFDSHVSSLALVEALVAGVHARLSATTPERIKLLDDIVRTLETDL